MTTYVHIDIEALKELNDKLDDRVQQVRELRNELENMGEIERQLHVVEEWNTANQQVIVQRDAEIGGLMWENGRLRAEAESLAGLLLQHSAERDAARQELARSVTREAFDTVVRVQAQETSMKITAQRALDDAQKRIAHLEAQDRATVNACNERHADPRAIRRAANIIACERERRHRWEEWAVEARHELSASNKRIDELMVQLEQSRKHLAASRTIRKRELENIQRLQQENLTLVYQRLRLRTLLHSTTTESSHN